MFFTSTLIMLLVDLVLFVSVFVLNTLVLPPLSLTTAVTAATGLFLLLFVLLLVEFFRDPLLVERLIQKTKEIIII